ncbi:U3 small nucleolar RNA-associated protein, variant 2 [Entomophthora muscae]|nr:U3 small nucleolar RNA-associated protein, variant 2 [Entomophthora muscae]
MKVEYGPNWKTTPIWDLVVVSGNTIASGDGKGNLTLFDGEFGTMLSTFRSHEVDILCLATNKAGTEIYSGGVDSKINRYILNQLSATSDWSVQSHRRHHKHDTKSLVLFESANSTRLFSGGMDMRLSSVVTSNFTFAKFQTQAAFPQPSPIHLAPSRKLLMATYSDRAKIWKLGSAMGHPISTKLKAGTNLTLVDDYKEQLAILTESTHNTLSSAISSDGNWVALADIDQLRLFRISWSENTNKPPSLELIPNFPPTDFTKACIGQCHTAKELLFAGNELIVATTSGQVFALGLENSKCREFSELFSEKELAGQVIASLKVDKLSSRLLITLSNNLAAVVDISSRKRLLKHHLGHKGYKQALLVSKSKLAVVDSNWAVIYYTLDNLTSPSYISSPLKGPAGSHPQSFINANDSVVLYNSQYITSSDMVKPSLMHKPRHLGPHPYGEIMFMGCLSSDQIVIVERPYEEILARLPPAFASKLYTGACKKARIGY